MPALPERHPVRLPHMPALDGLRAIAVVAVILYHAGASSVPGGFLGVELFFVLSGFLISSLLQVEAGAGNGVQLAAFWRRRARRLLPAAYALIACTLLFARVHSPSELPSLRQDGAAGVAYLSNWWLILENKSYFEQAGRPSLLQHLWSLAVEAQFYLAFPLLFGALLGRLRARVSALLCVLLALAGASLMGYRFDPDVDPSPLYYGTDTRAAGLLLGAALAFLRPPSLTPHDPARLTPNRWAGPLGLLSGGLVMIAFVFVSEYDEGLYRGGLLGFSCVSAALIAALVAAPAGLLGRALSVPVLQAVGRRSYSLYLWHWPVLMVSRPDIDVAISGPKLWLAQGLSTLLLAEFSYRCVELPVRGGALARALRSVAARRRPADRLAAAFAVTSGLLFVVVLGSAVWTFEPSVTAEQREKGARGEDGEHAADPLRASAAFAAMPDHPASRPSAAGASAGDPPRALQAAEPTHGKRPRLVLAVGDSVMRGAERELRQRNMPVVVDAVVGRQVSQTLPLLRGFMQAGKLAPLVVVHLGNNGTFRARQFDRMMRVLGRSRHVVFVNTKVPRRWQDPNNQVLLDGVARYPNTSLVDWKGFSVGRSEWFARDGYHLRKAGAEAYANLLSEHCYLPDGHERAAIRQPASLRKARLAQFSMGGQARPAWVGL